MKLSKCLSQDILSCAVCYDLIMNESIHFMGCGINVLRFFYSYFSFLFRNMHCNVCISLESQACMLGYQNISLLFYTTVIKKYCYSLCIRFSLRNHYSHMSTAFVSLFVWCQSRPFLLILVLFKYVWDPKDHHLRALGEVAKTMQVKV